MLRTTITKHTRLASLLERLPRNVCLVLGYESYANIEIFMWWSLQLFLSLISIIIIFMVNPNYPIKGNYKKGSIEKWFQKELFSFMEKDGYICYHIPDNTYWYRLLDGICVSPTGEIFFLELKKIELYTFNVSAFEDSQVAFMNELIARGNTPYIGIFSIATNTYIITTWQDVLNKVNEKGGIKFFEKVVS